MYVCMYERQNGYNSLTMLKFRNQKLLYLMFIVRCLVGYVV